jgi:hypothetical protein
VHGAARENVLASPFHYAARQCRRSDPMIGGACAYGQKARRFSDVREVRSSPESGRLADIGGRRRSATSGCEQVQ